MMNDKVTINLQVGQQPMIYQVIHTICSYLKILKNLIDKCTTFFDNQIAQEMKAINPKSEGAVFESMIIYLYLFISQL